MSSGTPEITPVCPQENICRMTRERGPQCGLSFDHLPPLELAEELCPRAIMGALMLQDARTTTAAMRDPVTRSSYHHRRGSLLLDLSLSTSGLVSPDKSDEYFEAAFNDFEIAFKTPNQKTRKEIHFLMTGKEGFRLRQTQAAHPLPNNPENTKKREARFALASQITLNGIIEITNSTLNHTTDPLDFGHIAPYLIEMRAGRLPHPANARETLSLPGIGHPNILDKHSFYSIETTPTSEIKIPYRTEPGLNGADMSQVVVAGFMPLAYSALGKIFPDYRLSRFEAAQTTLRLLRDNAIGQDLHPKEQDIINYVANRIEHRRQRLLTRIASKD